MPFYNNVYYAFAGEPSAAPSTVGIPSLINSPESCPTSGSQCGPAGSAMSGGYTSGSAALPAPFKFRSHRESVDWRRINAVDVDRVACELDFQTLQEHIAVVTFCSLEGERCMRCHSAVDPALLKLFRLAQLTLEYLLHSQDCLSLSLQAAEERVRAETREKEQLRAQLQKQSQDVKSIKEELKQRKKIITSQQAMISAGLTNYHKCQHCEKAFLNTSFLHSHMQRRHPTEYDIKLMTDNQKNVQTVKLQDEINRLQEQLSLARSQMEMQQKDYNAKQEKDLTQKQDEFMKQLEIWKEAEKVRMNSKIDEVKQVCQRDMDSLHQRNRNLEKEVLKLQKSCKMQEDMQATQAQAQAQASSIHNNGDKHMQEVSHLRQKLHNQESKWVTKLQKLKEEHENEKHQLQTSLLHLHTSVSEQKVKQQRHMEKLEVRLQEQQQIISSQNKQMKQTTSTSPTSPEVVDEQDVQQTNLVHKLDPIVELSEEDKDSSGVSESLPESQSWQLRANNLLKNPSFKEDMRLAVQQSLHDKLLNLGIQPEACGLSKTTYKKVMTQVISERQQRQCEDPEYRKLQKSISHKLDHRVKERSTGAPFTPHRPVQVMTIPQSRSRSNSLPVSVTKVSGIPPRRQHTPQPSRYNSGSQPKTSTPLAPQNRAPQFSSDDDSSEEDEPEDKHPQPQKVLQVNTTSGKTQASRPQQRTATSALVSVQKAVQGSRAPVLSTSKMEVTALESESDWTEASEMEEIALDHLQKHTDQNGNVQKPFHSYVNSPSNNLGKQLTQQGQKKAGGRIVSEKSTGVSDNVVQQLKYTDKNADDDDDDWDISSLEEIPAAQKLSHVPVRKSTDKSYDTSTSVWGTFTGKGQEAGLKDAGTGSTLKSSIVTVSDWDDSDGK